MARNCLDNGLQAKAAGSKPILFPANQYLVTDDIVLKGAFPCARPFQSLTFTLFTSLV